MNWRWGLIGLLVLGMGVWKWESRPVRYPKFIYPKSDPVQIAGEAFSVRKGEVQIFGRASYDIEARVVAKKRYRWSASAGFAPWDLGLAWGPASSQRVLDELSFGINDRYLCAQWSEFPPLAPEQIMVHIANVHIIPADDQVESLIRRVRVGELVRLRGYLVDVAGPNGESWKTSLSREDSGAGACEVMYVQSVRVGLPMEQGAQ